MLLLSEPKMLIDSGNEINLVDLTGEGVRI